MNALTPPHPNRATTGATAEAATGATTGATAAWWDGPRAGGLIVLVGLALRLAHLADFSRLPIFDRPTVDAALYLDAARAWAHGEFPGVFFKPPLYPALLAAWWHLCGDNFFALRLLGATAGAATCGVTWWIAKRLFGPRVALAAGLLIALHRTALFFDGELLETSVATLLHMLGLALVLRAGEPKSSGGRAALAGAVLGLGALARPVILLFTLVGGAWLGRRRLAPLAAGFALALAPATLHNAVRGHDAVLVSANWGLNFYLGNNPRADGRSAIADALPANPAAAERLSRTIAEATQGHSLRPSQVSNFWAWRGLSYAAGNPAHSLALALRKLFFAWNVAEISDNEDLSGLAHHLHVYGCSPAAAWLLMPLGLAGLCLAPRRRDLDLARGYVAAQIVALLPFFVVARFRVPWLPALAIFAAWCGGEAVQRIRRRTPGSLRFAGVIGASAVFCGAPLFGVRAPVDFDLDYKIAYAYQQKGQLPQALAGYRAAVARNPHNALALNALGLLTADQGGDLGAAEDLISRALRADALHVTHYTESLADIRLRRGNPIGALAACKDGLAAATEPTARAALLWRRAQAYRALGATESELTTLRQVLETGVLSDQAAAARTRQDEVIRSRAAP